MSSRWNENSKSYDDFKVGDDLKQKLTESGMAEGAQDQTKPKLMDVVARETTSASPVDTHIIDLRFVFRHALRWSWVILVATAIGAASGLWDAHQFSRTSVAKMAVLPVESGGVSASQGNVSGGVGQLLGRLGGGHTNSDNIARPSDLCCLDNFSGEDPARKIRPHADRLCRIMGPGYRKLAQAYRRGLRAKGEN